MGALGTMVATIFNANAIIMQAFEILTDRASFDGRLLAETTCFLILEEVFDIVNGILVEPDRPVHTL